MKRLSIILGVCALCAAGIGVILLTGCEVDSAATATEALTVNPSSVMVEKGQSVEFTVSGGYEYTWSLAPDDGSGFLATKTGDRVMYTCIGTNGTIPKKVLVTSTITGTSASTTNNQASYFVQGSANIYFKGGGTVTPLSISTTRDTLTDGTTAQLTANDGTPGYSWTKDPTTLGTFSSSTGSKVIFTCKGGAGTVVITCTDSSGDTESLTIVQQN
jgi:hypothetical protein